MRKYKINTHTRDGAPRWFIVFAESMSDAVDLLAFCPGYVKAPLEKVMVTHSSILAWRIPDKGAWQAHGVTKSQIRLTI